MRGKIDANDKYVGKNNLRGITWRRSVRGAEEASACGDACMIDKRIVSECTVVANSGDGMVRIPWDARGDCLVRVEKKDGVEAIIYDGERMSKDKPYFIEWYGVKCAIVRRGDTVTLMAEDEV